MVLSGSLSTIAIMTRLMRQHGTLVLRCQLIEQESAATRFICHCGVSVGSPRQRAPIASVLAQCAIVPVL